jgi:hypothetical protein
MKGLQILPRPGINLHGREASKTESEMRRTQRGEGVLRVIFDMSGLRGREEMRGNVHREKL